LRRVSQHRPPAGMARASCGCRDTNRDGDTSARPSSAAECCTVRSRNCRKVNVGIIKETVKQTSKLRCILAAQYAERPDRELVNSDRFKFCTGNRSALGLANRKGKKGKFRKHHTDQYREHRNITKPPQNEASPGPPFIKFLINSLLSLSLSQPWNPRHRGVATELSLFFSLWSSYSTLSFSLSPSLSLPLSRSSKEGLPFRAQILVKRILYVYAHRPDELLYCVCVCVCVCV
jgi:hypothetical protein